MSNEMSTPGPDVPRELNSDICQFVTFVVGDEVFAVDLAPVQEIIRVPEVVAVPMAPPRASEPTSPMKIFAGWALYHRNPMEAPTIVPQKTVNSPTRCICCSSR